MQQQITAAAQVLAASKRTAALTGAGMSVESGIPPFRGKGGLWERIDPFEYAHIDAFRKDPRKVWNVLLKDMKIMLDTAEPNDSHKGLARLEELNRLNTIITQNIDGLHQAAGNTDVIEFHGTFAWHRCTDCSQRLKSCALDLKEIPPPCECGGIFRPDCVFFGEAIPMGLLNRSWDVAANCDVMLVIGTSAVVQPAAMMPVIAKKAGAKIIEINPESTLLTDSVSDYFLRGKAVEVVTQIVCEVEKLIS